MALPVDDQRNTLVFHRATCVSHDNYLDNKSIEVNSLAIEMTTAVAALVFGNENNGMTPETCRAGRALIGLSQGELAKQVGVTPLAIRNYESGKSDPALSRWHAIKRVLEKGGVLFIDEDDTDGPGVRLRKPRGRK